MKHWIFYICMIIFLATAAQAQPNFLIESSTTLKVITPQSLIQKVNTSFDMDTHVFNGTDYFVNTTDADCVLHLYNPTGTHLFEGDMEKGNGDFEYTVNASLIPKVGSYPILIWCWTATEAGFTSFSITVTEAYDSEFNSGNSDFPGFFLFIPLIFAAILLVGAASLGEDHPALKIFLYLLSFIPFISSLHIAALTAVRFYGWNDLQNYLGTITYWSGLIFIAIISYFAIYMIYKGFKAAAQDRKERLEY